MNSIAPGAIRTPINRESWDNPEAKAELLKLIPRNRIGEPSDIAKAALWLASDETDYVHGTSLIVDVGMILSPGSPPPAKPLPPGGLRPLAIWMHFNESAASIYIGFVPIQSQRKSNLEAAERIFIYKESPCFTDTLLQKK